MTPAQQLWLERVVSLIPRLVEQIEAGNRRAEFNIGRRVIDGRRVRLVLRADLIDDATSSSNQDEPEHDAIVTS